VALNKPVDPVVTTAGDVLWFVPSNLIVIKELAAKPEPDTDTVEPMTPVVGFKEIEEVTLKMAATPFVPSVARTIWVPATHTGTVNVAVNPPVPEETIEVGEVIRSSPSKLRVIVEFAAKPKPATVTVEPTLPAVGFNEIRGPTVKKAEAESANASVAVTM